MAAISAAAGDPIKGLCEEATCPICLKYFRDPVTTECGHNFCRVCLTHCWVEPSTVEIPCPQCREKVLKKNLKPNRQLVNIVELTKKLSLRRPRKEEGREGICEKHKEPFKLFCKDHETSICVVCDKSKEHDHHKVIPLDEALETYKDQIWKLLETLKEEKETILAYKAGTEDKSHDMLKRAEMEKEKTVAAFRQMHQFLEEQEKLLLAQLEEVEKEAAAKREDHLAKLSEELSSLEDLIREVEEKLQQPASDLLEDIGSFLLGYGKKETFGNPMTFPPALRWKLWDFCDMNLYLEAILKQFKDTLKCGLPVKKADVTLDAETANPYLILSNDYQTVTFGEDYQDLPDNPERFDKCHYVLGHEGFTGGRHFWEVIVETAEEWAVGVARKSVKRKGESPYESHGWIWEMRKWKDQYWACYPKTNSIFLLKYKPKRIRVTLNCEGGRVAFYNADTAALMFEYPKVSFSGETLHPSFYLSGESRLTISPPNKRRF